MKLFKKETALTAFYYLLAADGEISRDEEQTFCEIGRALDPNRFEVYRESIMNKCSDQMEKAENEDEYFDVLQEGADFALSQQTNILEEGISARLLLWDLITLAYSDGRYDSQERRLIRHIVRVMQIDKSVALEMEQIAETSLSVRKEYEWIQTQNKTYAEIRPIVDELESRMKTLRKSAECLISDEVFEPEPEEKTTVLSLMKEKVSERVAPTMEKTQESFTNMKKKTVETVAPIKKKVEEAVVPLGKDWKEKSNKLFDNLSKNAKDSIRSAKKSFSFMKQKPKAETQTDLLNEQEQSTKGDEE